MVTDDFKEFEKKRIEAEISHNEIIQQILDNSANNGIGSLYQPEYSMMWRNEYRMTTPKAVKVRQLANEIVDNALKGDK